MMKGKNIVLGITGGIAAYRSAQIARDLTKRGANVFCILTKNALNFITQQTMETLTGNPAVVDMFARPNKWEVEHIELAKRADVFLVAPASANFIGKVASGIADDMLTTTVMATKAPLLIAPAMNSNMYENPIFQRNMQTLKDVLHAQFIEPKVGLLACNDVGKGHIADDQTIIDAVERVFTPKDFAGKRVLVTAGPTREAIDPVRFVSNHSSGRMGYALAEAAYQRGAEVTLVSGPVALECPEGVHRIFVESTQDLYDTMIKSCTSQDVIIQAAAPADYRPDNIAEQKIKKSTGSTLDIHMIENPDVASAIGQMKKNGQILVAFAAETENLKSNAIAKLEKKNADLIVGNDVTRPGAGFNVDTNVVTLFDRNGSVEYPLMKKTEVADKILDRVAELFNK